MRIRAVIFDVYGTLLEVTPPPADAEARWQQLCRNSFKASQLSLAAFNKACDQVIAREHALAQSAGILFPEIFWPAVAGEALPALQALGEDDRAEFLFREAQLWHTVRLQPGAVPVLLQLHRKVLLGIASNAQPYTLRELGEGMDDAGLPADLFDPELSFWSFAHGFSKPNPHVFQILAARLQARGISPKETLMVGDRQDKDTDPARANGWQTWQISSSLSDPPYSGKGTWAQLAKHLSERCL